MPKYMTRMKYGHSRDGYPVEWFTRDMLDRWMRHVGEEMKKWTEDVA